MASAPHMKSRLSSRGCRSALTVSEWMRANRLQLNCSKTEVLWCASPQQHDNLPDTPLRIGNDTVVPVRSVRNLGIYVDSDMSMRTHVTKIVTNCFASLRRLCSIRRSLSQSVLLSLVTALTVTRLDYGCTTLAGIPRHLTDRLQSVLNAAVRLVFSALKYDYVSHLLRDLYWLRDVFLGAVSGKLPLTSAASFDPYVNARRVSRRHRSPSYARSLPHSTTVLPGQQGQSRHCT